MGNGPRTVVLLSGMAGSAASMAPYAGFSSAGFYAIHQAIHTPDRLASITLPDPTTVTVGFAPTTMLLGLAASMVNRDWLWRR